MEAVVSTQEYMGTPCWRGRSLPLHVCVLFAQGCLECSLLGARRLEAGPLPPLSTPQLAFGGRALLARESSACAQLADSRNGCCVMSGRTIATPIQTVPGARTAIACVVCPR